MVEIYRPTLSEVLDGTELTEAEGKLLAACKRGEVAFCGSEVPDAPNDSNRIRGDLIRYLLLGGCAAHRPSPTGVQIWGAWIEPALDFKGCETSLDLVMANCRFPQEPILMDAKLGRLNLSGCHLDAGLDLHRIETENDILLRDGLRCTGLVDLGGAQIGGQLDCSGADFMVKDGIALDCDAIKVGASVLLRDGFKAQGQVNLKGAEIGGQLTCTKGEFTVKDGIALNCNAIKVGADVFLGNEAVVKGGLDFTGARIGGELHISNATLKGSISCRVMQVDEALTWQKAKGEVSAFDLTDARVGKLKDDAESWSIVKKLDLTDFRYEAIDGGMGVQERLDDWLARNGVDPETHGPNHPDSIRAFEPQPYSQYAKVLEAQGRRRAAARVLFEREKRLRRAELRRELDRGKGDTNQFFLRLKTFLWQVLSTGYLWFFGYGHRPLRALFTAAILVSVAAVLYGHIYRQGQMAPNSDVILTSVDWYESLNDPRACDDVPEPGCVMPLVLWTGDAAQGIAPKPSAVDYETFSPILYGLDLFVPLDALGQETTWAPSWERGVWGKVGYSARWFFQMMGWILTATGAAVLTGLVGRKD